MLSSQILSTSLKSITSNSNPSLFSYHRSNAPPIPNSLRIEPLESHQKIDESSRFPVEPLESQPTIEGPSRFPAKPFKSQPANEEYSLSENEDPLLEEKVVDDVGKEGNGVKEEKRISGIHVPRQSYISVSKAELLDGILSTYKSQENIDEFLRLSLCLDSIIHAEHKGILEEMRIDYSSLEARRNSGSSLVTSEGNLVDSSQTTASANSFVNESMESRQEKERNDKVVLPFDYGLDLSFLLRLSDRNSKRKSATESRYCRG